MFVWTEGLWFCIVKAFLAQCKFELGIITWTAKNLTVILQGIIRGKKNTVSRTHFHFGNKSCPMSRQNIMNWGAWQAFFKIFCSKYSYPCNICCFGNETILHCQSSRDTVTSSMQEKFSERNGLEKWGRTIFMLSSMKERAKSKVSVHEEDI